VSWKQLDRERLTKAAKAAKRKAMAGPINPGTKSPEFLAQFMTVVKLTEVSVGILYSRDSNHHMGGWWKNPDYERCMHLSTSYRSPDGTILLPNDKSISGLLSRMLFGRHYKSAWVESPFSPDGKLHDVLHHRLFCDPSWAPILPRGEVYSSNLTSTGWRSFSEIHGESDVY